MKRFVPLLVLPLLLEGVALGAGSRQDAANQSSCGPKGVRFNAQKINSNPAQQVHKDSALVYVISQLDYGGFTVGCQVVSRIGLDGKWLGANCGSSYLSAVVPAGEHHLCVDWQSAVFLSSRPHPALDSFTAEAGKTYYFRAKEVYAEGLTTLDLDPLNADEGKLLTASEPASASRPKRGKQ